MCEFRISINVVIERATASGVGNPVDWWGRWRCDGKGVNGCMRDICEKQGNS
jgi:hypothetical protein